MCFAGLCKPTVQDKRKYPSSMGVTLWAVSSSSCQTPKCFMFFDFWSLKSVNMWWEKDRGGPWSRPTLPWQLKLFAQFHPWGLWFGVSVFQQHQSWDHKSHTGRSLNRIWPQSHKTVTCIFRWSMGLWIIQILISRDNRNIWEQMIEDSKVRLVTSGVMDEDTAKWDWWRLLLRNLIHI